jgi:hypothetical protein
MSRRRTTTRIFLCLAHFFVYASAGAQDYLYSQSNKIDPFLPMSLKKTSVRGLSRLQDFSVDELELVGTVFGGEISALIMTPDKEGVLSKIGDRVGKKGGRIIAISNDKVVVREPLVGVGGSGALKGYSDAILPLMAKPKRSSTLPNQSMNGMSNGGVILPYFMGGFRGAPASPNDAIAPTTAVPGDFFNPNSKLPRFPKSRESR